MLSQDISVASIPNDDDPTSVPPAAPPAGAKSSRFSLESALHAKPFVPQALQKVSCWLLSFLLVIDNAVPALPECVAVLLADPWQVTAVGIGTPLVWLLAIV